ncbi:MAG: M43 family zinc metalloprotease [Flavobacteriales bacterium]|jgi:hypothetical protein|nr:M43 family zinc metalloprotease [Flavobacteriales bacterium]
MLKYSFIVFYLLFIVSDIVAQGFCGHHTHPITKDEMKEVIRLSRLGETKAIGCRENNVYTVPVVIHVMHTGQSVGSGINISDAQATSLIDALNRDFRATHSISQRGVYVDTRIDFCLAKQDPSGNPTTGITRHNCSSVGNYATRGIRVFTPGTGGVTPRSIASRPGATWDVNRYLNIWVISEIDNQGQNNVNTFSGGYLGFAPLSPTAGTTPTQMWNTNLADPDGGTMPGVAGCFIVASACLGVNTSAQANSAGYFFWNQRLAYQGRVGTHEIGHYFGLPHTFSDFNPNVCSNGDGIGDTGNARVVANACSGGCNNQNVENYMDYNNQNCIGEFTAGQRTVMRSRMSGGFSTMTQCAKCEPRYDLSIDNVTVNKNDCDLTFTGNIDVTNIGTQTLNNFKIRYRVNNGAWTTYTWTGILSSGNATTISIPNISGVNGANSFEVEVRVNTLNTSNSDQEVSNNNGVRNFTMNQPPAVSIVASKTAICIGESAVLTASGSSTYSWDNGLGTSAVQTVSPSTATTYSVTGTTSGCQTTANVQIQYIPHSPPSVTANATSQALCMGDNVTLTGSGALNYTWDHGVTDGTAFSPTSTVTYTVRGTDVNGCSNDAQVQVVVNPLPTVVAQSTKDTACTGNTVVFSGGGAQSYSWTNGVTDGVSYLPTVSGTYTVTGTDANGCVNQDQVYLEVLPSPNVSLSLTEVNLCKDETVSVSASGGVSYFWNNYETTNAITVTYPTSLDSVSVYGIDNIDYCSTYVAIPLNQSNMETSLIPSYRMCQGDSLQIEVQQVGGVGVSYAWNLGLGDTNVHTITPNLTTNYTVVATDAYGCDDTLSTEVEVIAYPNMSLTHDTVVLCRGETELVVASGADSYLWNIGGTNASITLDYPLGVDSIVLTGVNDGLCEQQKILYVGESFMENTITSSLVMCEGDMVTIAVESTDLNSSFSWDNGLPAIEAHQVSPLSTTVYNVVVTDNYECRDTLTTEITVIQTPNLILDQSEVVLCSGDEVVVSASGANVYSWNTGDTVSQVTVSYPSGLDSLKLRGVNGGACVGEVSIPIKQSQIDGVISGAQHICEGDNATIIVSGTTPNITYEWNQGLPNSNYHIVSPSTTTEYQVVLVDDLMCRDSLSSIIYVDTVPSLSVSPTSVSICQGVATTFTPSGANSYVWSTGDTIAELTSVFEYSTTLTLTGINGGCSQQLSIPVQVNPNAVVIADANTYSINTGEGIQFFNTGSIASTYLWDFGDGGTSIMGNPYHIYNTAGAYYVVLSGVEGDCSSSDSVLVYVGYVGVEENSQNTIKIYPNPSSGIFNIKSTEVDWTHTLVHDAIGRLVYSAEQENILDLSYLSDGVYTVSLVGNKSIRHLKVQVKK